MIAFLTCLCDWALRQGTLGALCGALEAYPATLRILKQYALAGAMRCELHRVATIGSRLRSVLSRFLVSHPLEKTPIEASARAAAQPSRARGGRFVRHATILGMGSIASQIGLLICAPILTRIYAPAAIGTWALFMTMASLLSIIAIGKYEYAIVLPARDALAFNIVILCTLLMIIMTVLFTCIILFVGPDNVTLFLGFELSPVFLLLIPLLSFAYSVHEVCRYWVLREEQFWIMSAFIIIQAWAVAAVQIVVGMASGGGATELVVGSVLASFAAAGLFAAMVLVRIRRRLWRCVGGRRLIEVTKRYRNFPMYSAPDALLAMAASRALFILLAAYASPAAVGFLALAIRVTSLPNSLISPALNTAFLRWAASHIDQPRVLESLIRNVLRIKIIVGTPAVVLFALNAEELFALVFGSPWREAGAYASFLMIGSFCLLLTNWLSHAYSVLHKQKLALILETAYNVVMLTAVLACLTSGFGPIWTIAAFSVVMAVYNVIWLGITLIVMKLSMMLLAKILGLMALITAVSAVVHIGAAHLLSPYGYIVVCLAFVAAVWGYAGREALTLVRATDSPNIGDSQ